MIKSIFVLIISSFFLFSQDVPDWILQTEDSKYIYGVGSALKDISFSRQIRIAKMTARANLSENIAVEVSSSFEKNSSKNHTDISYSTTQKSRNILKYISVQKKWINQDGELFILLAIEKKDLVTLP